MPHFPVFAFRFYCRHNNSFYRAENNSIETQYGNSDVSLNVKKTIFCDVLADFIVIYTIVHRIRHTEFINIAQTNL